MIKYCKKHERYHGEDCIDCVRKKPSIEEQKKTLEGILKEQRTNFQADRKKQEKKNKKILKSGGVVTHP